MTMIYFLLAILINLNWFCESLDVELYGFGSTQLCLLPARMFTLGENMPEDSGGCQYAGMPSWGLVGNYMFSGTGRLVTSK